MASPTTPVGATAANAAVGRLVLEIQAGIDDLVDAIVARIRDELPDFRRLPASTLARAVARRGARASDASAARLRTRGPWARYRCSAVPIGQGRLVGVLRRMFGSREASVEVDRFSGQATIVSLREGGP